MTTPTFILVLDFDLAKGWQWVKTEAADIYGAVTKSIGPALQSFGSSVESVLWGAAASVVSKIKVSGASGFNLADIETAFMNVLGGLGGPVIQAAEFLGSKVIQTLLGALHIQMSPPAVPGSPAAA